MTRLTGLVAVAGFAGLARQVAGDLLAVSTHYPADNCAGDAGTKQLMGLDGACTNSGEYSFRVNCAAGTQSYFVGNGCAGEPSQINHGCEAIGGAGSRNVTCQYMEKSEYVTFVGNSGTCSEPALQSYDVFSFTGCAATSTLASRRVTTNSTGIKYEIFQHTNDCSEAAGTTIEARYGDCVVVNNLSGAFVEELTWSTLAPTAAPTALPSNNTGDVTAPPSNQSTNDSGNATAAPTSEASQLSSLTGSTGMVVMSVLASLLAF